MDNFTQYFISNFQIKKLISHAIKTLKNSIEKLIKGVSMNNGIYRRSLIHNMLIYNLRKIPKIHLISFSLHLVYSRLCFLGMQQFHYFVRENRLMLNLALQFLHSVVLSGNFKF
jgi:hypothetical protein